jgi:uncharacterized alkaline shock family protein YloU
MVWIKTESGVYMTEIKSEGAGTVRIADEVIAVIAGTAAMETEGVAGLAGHFFNDTANKTLRKLMAKGINVTVTGQSVSLNLAVTVRMGAKLHEVGAEVQERVKTAIETMTGLDVTEVNISVGAITSQKRRPRP